MLFERTPNAVVIWSISHSSSNNRYKALCFMSGLIARYTMYVQGEYNNDWERVGGEESVSGIFRIFRIFAIFEPPQNAWDKNFRNECSSCRVCSLVCCLKLSGR